MFFRYSEFEWNLSCGGNEKIMYCQLIAKIKLPCMHINLVVGNIVLYVFFKRQFTRVSHPYNALYFSMARETVKCFPWNFQPLDFTNIIWSQILWFSLILRSIDRTFWIIFHRLHQPCWQWVWIYNVKEFCAKNLCNTTYIFWQ